jgi:tripartite-type tricarboxylate transporter receptor subunit TctC
MPLSISEFVRIPAHHGRRRRPVAVLAAAIAFAVSGAQQACAQTPYPSRPIQLIVPFTAGGATDVLARLVAERLRVAWGQPVIVENRLGASGNIGANAVAKAAPDGYTLLMGAIGTNAVNAALFETMPYNTAKDFAPITQVASLPMVVAVNPELPIKSTSDLIKFAKEKPKFLNHGSAGKGASQHLASVLFETMAGVQFEQIFYRGGAAVLPDLLTGRIHLSFGDMVSLVPSIKDKKLRAIAVTSLKRSTLLPDVPTIDESGVKGYDAAAWYGMFAPAGTPPAIVNKLNAAIVDSLKAPDIIERFATLGAEPVGSSPEEFKAFVLTEMERWAKVVKASGVRAD